MKLVTPWVYAPSSKYDRGEAIPPADDLLSFVRPATAGLFSAISIASNCMQKIKPSEID